MTKPIADQNLLFGVIALRLNFINRDQLFSAMDAYVESEAGSLGEVLVERKSLTAKRRAMLDDLVREHLLDHNDNVERSLAEFCSSEVDVEEIGPSFLPDLKGCLDEIDETLSRADTDSRRSSTSDSPRHTSDATLMGGRFRVLQLHDEGGLGRVMLAEDEELGRTVVVKEIKPGHADNLVTQERFVLEAEITGGLEHPSIVPVYGLGKCPDGRPYYAMRFIRGDNLKAAIEEFHKLKATGQAHGLWQLELRKLLRRFIDVCNAVRYAHSRGVLHRDLKPANVMLGRFGETLLVDWGLAKLVGRSDDMSDLGEGVLHPSSGSGSYATMAGSVMGTPAYMSPEQAEGEVEQLGPTTDVYSLGATLYCVLTGNPPFVGRKDILERVKQGKFDPPRVANPLIPRPLNAICLHAMALKAEDRYASASGLIADLERWMADEPVTAYRETRRERLSRWMRNHRTWVRAGTATLVAVTAVSVFAAIVISRAWRAEADARAKRTQMFVQAREAVDEWLTGVGESLIYYPATGALREQLLRRASEDYEQFAEGEDEDLDLAIERGRTYLRLGHLGLMLRDGEKAKDAYVKAQTLFEQLEQRYPNDLVCRVELANCQTNQGVVFWESGQTDQADAAFQESAATLSELVNEAPSEWIATEALATTMLNRGELLLELERLDEAESILRRCGESLSRFPSKQPSIGKLLSNARSLLSRVLLRMGRYSEAAAEMDAAIELSKSTDPTSLDYWDHQASMNIDLANALLPLGRRKEAATAYQLALADYQSLAEAIPGDPNVQEKLAITRCDLGRLLYLLGRAEDAEVQLTNASQILDVLVAYDREFPRYLDFWAYCRLIQGQLLRDRGQFQFAKGKLEEAIQIYEHLLQPNADVTADTTRQYTERFAFCQSHLGQTLYRLGEQDAADLALQKAIVSFSGLEGLLPNSQDGLAFAHYFRAILLMETGSNEEANRSMEQAREIWRSLASRKDPAAEHRSHWARMLTDCPLIDFRDSKLAISIAAELTEEVPDNADYWNILGLAHYRNEDWQAAQNALDVAVRVRAEDHGLDLCVLAVIHWKLGDRDKAGELHRRGKEWIETNLPYNDRLRRICQESTELIEGKP